jgi:molecular chaperone HtpG
MIFPEGGDNVTKNMKESTQDALENLIEQFSDVYCFYRELIQNSLDAGTNRVDVDLEFKPPLEPGQDGVMIIHVDDYGEGMNRQIIDSQLTRLFSSSKENDRTKIGKFGIGFVSVFAIKPDAVNIDTSRDGEDWRIIFNKDKTFQRFKRDYPVDGTKIKIIKGCSEKFFNNFRERSLQTVIFWCKHSEAEIYFNGEQVNKPYDIDASVKLHLKENAGEIIVGYTMEKTPFFGFYNQGLTLLEGNREYFPFVTFKMKSKYLEHTMTRDNVREDENYFKAMAFLESIVTKKLPVKLFETLETELLENSNESSVYKDILWLAMLYIADHTRLPKECLERKVARNTEGGFVTVADFINLRKAECFYFDNSSNPVTRTLHKDKKVVIKTTTSSRLYKELATLSRTYWKKALVIRASKAFFITKVIEQEKLEKVQLDLVKSVDHINRRMSHRSESLRFASFTYDGSCIKDKVYVMQEIPGQLSPIQSVDDRGKAVAGRFAVFARTRTLVLNNDHPYIKGILKLSEKNRDFASYLLAKLLYLDDGIDTETDTRLASIALERSRC